jgi:hypothetical protein
MTLIRNDILKYAFEGGLKTELLPGYENRIPVDADYATCVTTATDIESILARKKSTSQKNRHSEISAISLHQELLTNDVVELKRKFEGLNSSDNLQDRPRREISAVSDVSSENGRPYTGTPNLSLNSRAVRFGSNSTDERNRPNKKRPRQTELRSTPSPYMNRSPSPCTPEHANSHQSTPVHARARQCTPEHASARQSTPVHARARQCTPEHVNARQSTPVHARER